MPKRQPRNNFEKRICQELKKAKVGFTYEPHKINYQIFGNYLPDLLLSNGIYLELKGYFRPEHKVKLRAVKELHPELDLRIIFQSKSKANEKWCKKYHFPYAFGSIPKDWLVAH